MKLAIFLAAALSVAAPTASAAVILAEVTNPVNGPLVTGNGNYIQPGFTGNYGTASYFFTLHVRFGEDVYRRFDTLKFDYQTSGRTDFEVLVSATMPPGGQYLGPSKIAQFQEPAATGGFKTMEIYLRDLAIGQTDLGDGWTFGFTVVGYGASLGFDNVVLTTQGTAVNPVPEPGSMLGVACLLGAGAFVRRRVGWS